MKPALRHWLEPRAASVAGGTVCPAAPRGPSARRRVPVGRGARQKLRVRGARGAAARGVGGGATPRRGRGSSPGTRRVSLDPPVPRRPAPRSARVWPAGPLRPSSPPPLGAI